MLSWASVSAQKGTDLDLRDVAGGRDGRRPEPEELVDADDGVDQEEDGQQDVGQEGEDGPEAEVGPRLAVQRHGYDSSPDVYRTYNKIAFLVLVADKDSASERFKWCTSFSNN